MRIRTVVGALALFVLATTAAVASAQSLNSATSSPDPGKTDLLSTAAFSRLVQKTPRPTGPQTPSVSEEERPGRLRLVIVPKPHEMPAPRLAPPRKNTHKENLVAGLVIAGIVGFLFVGALLHSGD